MRASLPSILLSLIHQANTAWRAGVLLVDLSDERVLAEHRADDLFLPASLTKLVTTYAAAVCRPTADWSGPWQRMNRFSDNEAADEALKAIGGVEEARRALSTLALSPPMPIMNDGSGKNRENRLSPRQIVTVLMALRRQAPRAIDTFASPGEGTLRDRLPDLRGKLRAKTGSLRGTCGLAGFHEQVVFTFIVESSDDDADALRAFVDKLASQLLTPTNHETGSVK